MNLARPVRRSVAMLCVALCLALVTQMSVALLDRIQHALDVDHAPTMLAGQIEQEHGHGHDHAFDHDHDGAAADHDTPMSHHHQGDGMLTPWLTTALFVFGGTAVAQSADPVAAHRGPDVAERRRERPPKSRLERIA